MTEFNLKNTTLINVNGASYEYFDSQGDSKINLVFFNGFRMPLDSWSNIIPHVLDAGRVVAYNRKGVGKSSNALTDQTANIVIDDFRAFAQAINLKPPYLIITHSLGGLYADYYARRFPKEVAGIVFVESPHPDEVIEQKKIKVPVFLRAINESVKSFEKLFNKFKYSEDEVVLDSIAQIKNLENFPALPITVITGVQKLPFVPQGSFDIHVKYQKLMMELSPYSIHVLAEKSGHFPQITEPELVVRQIQIMVNKLGKHS